VSIEITSIAQDPQEDVMASREKKRILYGELLRAVALPLVEELGSSDRKRAEQILELSFGEKIRLSDCFPTLFPDLQDAPALKALTNFRSRFNQLAEELHLDLRLVVDSRKRDTPAQRFCWFEGADPVMAQVANLSEELTADIEGDHLVPPRGVVTTTSAMKANKRLVASLSPTPMPTRCWPRNW